METAEELIDELIRIEASSCRRESTYVKDGVRYFIIREVTSEDPAKDVKLRIGDLFMVIDEKTSWGKEQLKNRILKAFR